MRQKLGYVALLVRDYDEAIAFFTQSIGFRVVEDKPALDRHGRDKRWVLVAPRDARSTQILLAKAASPEEANYVGNQTGSRVFMFLHTDDFWRDYHDMTARGVRFREKPRSESYGTVAVFEDLYGNLWDLLQLSD